MMEIRRRVTDYLIHLLGGITQREVIERFIHEPMRSYGKESDRYFDEGVLKGRKIENLSLKRKMDKEYGKSAEEWCRDMYQWVLDEQKFLGCDINPESYKHRNDTV